MVQNQDKDGQSHPSEKVNRVEMQLINPNVSLLLGFIYVASLSYLFPDLDQTIHLCPNDEP